MLSRQEALDAGLAAALTNLNSRFRQAGTMKPKKWKTATLIFDAVRLKTDRLSWERTTEALNFTDSPTNLFLTFLRERGLSQIERIAIVGQESDAIVNKLGSEITEIGPMGLVTLVEDTLRECDLPLGWAKIGVTALEFARYRTLQAAREDGYRHFGSSSDGNPNEFLKRKDLHAESWKLQLQSLRVSEGERYFLQSLLLKVASCSWKAAPRLFMTLYERLREQAMVLDDKERDRMESRPTQVNNIYGTNYGTMNFGPILGSIYSSAKALSGEPSTAAVADAFSSLARALEHDQEMSEGKKKKALESIETLSEEAKLPVNQRHAGVFEAGLSYLPTILSTAVSGTKLWEAFGPTLEHFFRSL